ncbi:MAG TPA: MBL fold metallo-hydrolase [Verrucomicrobiales bacterium]|nr:MBL fold metallo-hydrolase [Verrucomicrobiales bacterium]
MKIRNLNPRDGIGASAWHIEFERGRILLDAGTDPTQEGRSSLPRFNLVENRELDAIALSHCHQDHIGSLPLAVRHFSKTDVYMTQPSYFLIERVLHNSVNVMGRRREDEGILDYPLYTHREVEEIAHLFKGRKYNSPESWVTASKNGSNPVDSRLEFFDAGHTLGSAGILASSENESVFYSSDVCFQDQILLKGARFGQVKADVLILETTRGAQVIPEGFTRGLEVKRLKKAIVEVGNVKGTLLIPSFGLGRTQEVLTLLSEMIQAGEIKEQPIYIGGLGKVFTDIYDMEAPRTHRRHPDLQLSSALNLVVLGRNQLNEMRIRKSRIYVMTSGMMVENTFSHDLIVRLAENPKASVFFVGYTAPDTPGGRFKSSENGKSFSFSRICPDLIRKCEVESFDLSAHANRDELLDFVGQVAPQTVILTHGEQDAREWINEQIKIRFPKTRILQPSPGELVEC